MVGSLPLECSIFIYIELQGKFDFILTAIHAYAYDIFNLDPASLKATEIFEVTCRIQV